MFIIWVFFMVLLHALILFGLPLYFFMKKQVKMALATFCVMSTIIVVHGLDQGILRRQRNTLISIAPSLSTYDIPMGTRRVCITDGKIFVDHCPKGTHFLKKSFFYLDETARIVLNEDQVQD